MKKRRRPISGIPQAPSTAPVSQGKKRRSVRGGRLASQPLVRRRQTVPMELTGKWIAWSADFMRILGHGETIQEARASAGNLPGLVIAFIPPAEQLRPVCKKKPETDV
jgi:hypothetical protein